MKEILILLFFSAIVGCMICVKVMIDNQFAHLKSKQILTEQKVYNIEVAGSHSYEVSPLRAIVHNCNMVDAQLATPPDASINRRLHEIDMGRGDIQWEVCPFLRWLGYVNPKDARGMEVVNFAQFSADLRDFSFRVQTKRSYINYIFARDTFRRYARGVMDNWHTHLNDFEATIQRAGDNAEYIYYKPRTLLRDIIKFNKDSLNHIDIGQIEARSTMLARHDMSLAMEQRNRIDIGLQLIPDYVFIVYHSPIQRYLDNVELDIDQVDFPHA